MKQFSVFIVSLIFLQFFSIFLIQIQYETIERIVSTIPLGLIEKSVFIIDNSDTIEGYFDKNSLKNNVNNYLKFNLKNKVSRYQISFFYYTVNENNEIKIDLNDYPKNVQIHFKTKYFFNLNLEKYLTFSIGDLIYEQ